MKKMPCVFVREFHGKSSFTITEQVTPGCEWVLEGEGIATRKWDGTACMVRDGKLYKRYDAKRGKTPPPNFEACGEPDDVTGHHPGWIPVGDEPESKWIREAWKNAIGDNGADWLDDGTYEAIGPRIGANADGWEYHALRRHGGWEYDVSFRGARTFDGIRAFLSVTPHEGIVFHHPDGIRMAKIRRKDFGFEWPVKRGSVVAA